MPGTIFRGEYKMDQHHNVKNLKFTESHLIIEIDGEYKKYEINKISNALSKASDTEKMIYEISPSGYGIHWPLIDEDISIDGLLGIAHLPVMEEMRV
jgi:hypothetical protein